MSSLLSRVKTLSAHDFFCLFLQHEVFFHRITYAESESSALDGIPFPPIIGRNYEHMSHLINLSVIVVLTTVLIIKGQFSVRMATVRVK